MVGFLGLSLSSWVVLATVLLFAILLRQLWCRGGQVSKHLLDTDLSENVVVITGATAGIGVSALRALVRCNAKRVYFLARNVAKAQLIHQEFTKEARDRVEVLKMDLSDYDSIRSASEAILARETRIDFLVLNAGMGANASTPRAIEDRVDICFRSNHLGHVLLTRLLFPLLVAEGEDSEESRIIITSSSALQFCTREKFLEGFDTTIADIRLGYVRSKLANSVFACELQRRVDDLIHHRRNLRDVAVASLHPGCVRTKLHRYGPTFFRVMVFLGWFFLKTPWEGAQTILHLALVPKFDDEMRGKYFEDCRIVNTRSPLIEDKELGEWLWEESTDFLGIEKDVNGWIELAS